MTMSLLLQSHKSGRGPSAVRTCTVRTSTVRTTGHGVRLIAVRLTTATASGSSLSLGTPRSLPPAVSAAVEAGVVEAVAVAVATMERAEAVAAEAASASASASLSACAHGAWRTHMVHAHPRSAWAQAITQLRAGGHSELALVQAHWACESQGDLVGGISAQDIVVPMLAKLASQPCPAVAAEAVVDAVAVGGPRRSARTAERKRLAEARDLHAQRHGLCTLAEARARGAHARAAQARAREEALAAQAEPGVT